MQPLRILHVAPYSPDAWAYGGIPRLTGALTRELARAGHEVTVCATDVYDAARRLPADVHHTPPGLTWRIFPNVSNRLAYHWQFFTPLGLGRYLRDEATRFDIAHLHACHNLPVTIAGHYLRRAGVPYVVAPNGTAPLIERRRLAKRLFDRLAGRDFLRRAAGVLAVSAAESRQLASLGLPAASIHYVPNPIDLEEFSPPPVRGRFAARFGLEGSRLVVYLGTLTPRKRVDTLIDAFAHVRRPGVHLVVAGNDMGSGRVLREHVSAHGLQARVHFTGLLTGRERLEALADAAVVVYPSEHEIFGLVPLEALLAGSPVIVCDDSGAGEVVNGTGGGLLVPPGDALRLAESITTMLDNEPRWRDAAADAASRVRTRYNASVVGSQLTGVYHQLLAAA